MKKQSIVADSPRPAKASRAGRPPGPLEGATFQIGRGASRPASRVGPAAKSRLPDARTPASRARSTRSPGKRGSPTRAARRGARSRSISSSLRNGARDHRSAGLRLCSRAAGAQAGLAGLPVELRHDAHDVDRPRARRRCAARPQGARLRASCRIRAVGAAGADPRDEGGQARTRPSAARPSRASMRSCAKRSPRRRTRCA